jgi:Fe2+ transport system protein FeoA
VRGYGEIPQHKLEQLQAYGLAIGRKVKVLQQEPLTVVLADHTELALEAPIAKEVNVELRRESSEKLAG